MSRMRQVISQRQTQNLLLKPKMLQSLEMLAMPLLELETHLKQEMISNPMLEINEVRDEEEESKEAEVTETEAADKEKTEKELEAELEAEHKKTLEESKELSEILDSYNDYYNEMGSRSSQSEDKVNFEQLLQAREDKMQEFFVQLDKLNLEDVEYEFAYEIIDSVNDYGFLTKGMSIYLLAEEYGIAEEKADEIHQMVMQLLPRGIAARTIQECLLAQLDDTEENEAVRSLIRENFDDLIHKRYKKITTKFNITLKTVYNWREIISKLDPKPGLRLASNPSNYIVPDVIIKKIENEFEIIVNDFSFPKIRMSRKYRQILNRVKTDREAVNYVRSKINSAKFLIKSIYLRGRTLERVTKAIIRNQAEFFYGNSGILHPLTYSVIADELQVNESTISRVVRSKYADTPFGIICLKDFFTSRAGKDVNYNSVSRQNVEIQIKKLIESENKSEPLSDQDLAEILKGQGINVSRRVVAKYRKAKGILNSHLRRKM
jgi:RNA polymerase sigma-54 factor